MNGFNDRLIEARERAGYSQTQLGEACDMASTQISRYEAGRATPRRATVKRLASALGVSEEWLLTGAGPAGQFLIETVPREASGSIFAPTLRQSESSMTWQVSRG